MAVVTQVKTLQLSKIIERAMEQVKYAIIRSNIVLDDANSYSCQENIGDYRITVTIEHVS